MYCQRSRIDDKDSNDNDDDLSSPKLLKVQSQSVYIMIEMLSHIIMQMRHYRNESLVLLWNYQQSWQSSHCEGYSSIQLGLHSRMHGHPMFSEERVAVRGAACQLRPASWVDQRAAGDLWYKLGLDNLGLCKPPVWSWNPPGDWQGARAMWPVLVWCGWIYTAQGPTQQHSSKYTEYKSTLYLGCCTAGCCNSGIQTFTYPGKR